jgi:hypothetical protein
MGERMKRILADLNGFLVALRPLALIFSDLALTGLFFIKPRSHKGHKA